MLRSSPDHGTLRLPNDDDEDDYDDDGGSGGADEDDDDNVIRGPYNAFP